MTYRTFVVNATLTVLFLALCGLCVWGYRQSEHLAATNYNLAVTSYNTSVASYALRGKVEQIDVAALNDSTRNIRLATGHANAILGNVETNLPKINKATFLLWKHADRTLGHLDEATGDWQKQQEAIATETTASLKATTKTVQDLDNLMTDAKVVDMLNHVDAVSAHLDSTTAHVDHVAEHYDKQLTAPKRWWTKLKDAGTAAGIWIARHL